MSITDRPVTERDFRMPEFRDAKVEDYEFRADGKLVRRDRWERGIHSIRFAVGLDGREFEIDDVVKRVEELAANEQAWVAMAECGDGDIVSASGLFDLKLLDGSILKGATRNARTGEFTWRAMVIDSGEVQDWREVPLPERFREPR